MNFSGFFIRRPVFAGVLSALIFLLGLLSLWRLPISEYPEVVPPTIVVRASYPWRTDVQKDGNGHRVDVSPRLLGRVVINRQRRIAVWTNELGSRHMFNPDVYPASGC